RHAASSTLGFRRHVAGRLPRLQTAPRIPDALDDHLATPEHGDGSIRLLASRADKEDASGPHPLMLRSEVVGMEEQKDSSPRLVADPLLLGDRCGTGEQ